jgi:uncharacterized protein (DUF433 family)
VDYRKVITVEAGKRGGKSCIRGMRITVGDVLHWMAAGMTEDEILSDFPELTRADLRAVLGYAGDLMNGGWRSREWSGGSDPP